MTRLSASVRIELPFPVPLHDCFTNVKGRGRVPTRRYKAYADHAQLMINRQHPGVVAGPVSVSVQLVAPDKRKRDGDNTLKCIFDTLTRAGIIEDDSNRIIKRHELVWAASGPPCVVIITEAQEGALAA